MILRVITNAVPSSTIPAKDDRLTLIAVSVLACILQDVLHEVGHPFHEAVWMLSLAIEQLRTELAWAEQVGHEFPRREPAHNPAYESK